MKYLGNVKYSDVNIFSLSGDQPRSLVGTRLSGDWGVGMNSIPAVFSASGPTGIVQWRAL